MRFSEPRLNTKLSLFHSYAITQLFKIARRNLLIRSDTGFDLDQVAFCLTRLHQTLFARVRP